MYFNERRKQVCRIPTAFSEIGFRASIARLEKEEEIGSGKGNKKEAGEARGAEGGGGGGTKGHCMHTIYKTIFSVSRKYYETAIVDYVARQRQIQHSVCEETD